MNYLNEMWLFLNEKKKQSRSQAIFFLLCWIVVKTEQHHAGVGVSIV